jgi:predicted aconitase with swiveling domain
MAVIARGRPLVDGEAQGPLLLLRAPISFWGGVDPATGTISRPDHPDRGRSIAGTILALPATIGSSSSSAVMLELMHNRHAPAGILMAAPDAILAIGVMVAVEMGWGSIPVFVCPLDRLSGHVALRLRSGGDIETGTGTFSPPGPPAPRGAVPPP